MNGETDIGDPITNHPHRIKRSHRKSRAGCLVCKQRRVKCDERRPCCSKCVIRGLDCAYAEIAVRSEPKFRIEGLPKFRKRRSRRFSAAANAAKELPPPGACVDELELMKYYFTHTMHSLASASRRKEVWEFWFVNLPSLALNSPTVRKGMLTMAAMSLHFQDPDSVDPNSKYLRTAEAHGEIFVEESRKQLERLEKGAVESHMACVKLLGTLAFAFYRTYRRNGVTLTDNAAWTWLHLQRGVLPVFTAITQSVQDVDQTTVQDMTSEVWCPGHNFDLTGFGGAIDNRNHPLFLLILQSRRERFTTLYTAVDQNTDIGLVTRNDDFITAIDLLKKITEHVCTGEVYSLIRTVSHFPGSVSKDFVSLLTSCDPLALAIHAHWLMLVIMLEDLWWIGDMGRAGIREVVGICSTADDCIQELLEWPRRAVDFGTEDHYYSPR